MVACHIHIISFVFIIIYLCCQIKEVIMLAHYTSVEGFNSIIAKDNLRLTRSEFMNDPSDSQVLGNMIEEYLKTSSKESQLVDKSIEHIYKKASVMNYIEFVQKKIHLYVLSFTDKADEMEFWNYYGNGGVQMNIDKENLLRNMASKIISEEEYLACAPVIYVSEKQELKDICLQGPLAEFMLRGKNNQSIFEEHMKKLDSERKQLYKIDNIQKFVDFFINDYCRSLKYLYEEKLITNTNSCDEILKTIFENQINANNKIIFKKDFLIYMILLSALVKTNSYEYEKETRIVYFENSLLNKKSKDDEYEPKTILGQRYIRPYIEFDKLQMYDALKSIVISPLARNIPIDDNLYKEVVKHFMESKGFMNVETNISKHKCRW